jgi:hypothetical protein
VVAIAAIDGFGLEFSFRPDLWSVADGFIVTLDTGVELAATLVLDGNNIALGVIVGALGASIHFGTVDIDRFG